MKNKPGVMIYFDLLPVLVNLSDEEKGKLFEAMLYYGRDGIEPRLPERTQLLWPLIKIRMDSDAERYDRTVLRKRYGAYVRWAKQKGREPMDYAAWQTSKCLGVVDDDYCTMEPEYLSEV